MLDRCVVDTSCLTVLDKVALLPLLCELYEKVYVPKSVAFIISVYDFNSKGNIALKKL